MNISELKQKLKNEPKHDFESLCQLVEVLRSEEGCPWDREQTHPSIRTDLIEETYEVVEAIDKDDRELLEEELGDVLFQVIFHSQIEREAGTFDIGDVIDGICGKMILRHPHVFGTVEVDGSAEVLENWDKIKTVEKSRLTVRQTLAAVPKQYPALLRAKKVIKKARKAGYDFGDPEEELRWDAAALASAEGEEKRRLLTAILWNTVALGGDDADLEMELSHAADDFIEEYPEEE